MLNQVHNLGFEVPALKAESVLILKPRYGPAAVHTSQDL